MTRCEVLYIVTNMNDSVLKMVTNMHIEVQTAAHCGGLTVAGGQMQRMQLMQTMNLHQESRNDIELMQKLHLVIQYILLIHHTQVYMVPLYMLCYNSSIPHICLFFYTGKIFGE